MDLKTLQAFWKLKIVKVSLCKLYIIIQTNNSTTIQFDKYQCIRFNDFIAHRNELKQITWLIGYLYNPHMQLQYSWLYYITYGLFYFLFTYIQFDMDKLFG